MYDNKTLVNVDVIRMMKLHATHRKATLPQMRRRTTAMHRLDLVTRVRFIKSYGL